MNTKTCANCVHSFKGNNTLLCNHDANPVTGEARHYANTQRLVGAKDEAKAEEAATLIGFCGPSGRFFQAVEYRRSMFGMTRVPGLIKSPPKPTAMAVPNT